LSCPMGTKKWSTMALVQAVRFNVQKDVRCWGYAAYAVQARRRSRQVVRNGGLNVQERGRPLPPQSGVVVKSAGRRRWW